MSCGIYCWAALFCQRDKFGQRVSLCILCAGINPELYILDYWFIGNIQGLRKVDATLGDYSKFLKLNCFFCSYGSERRKKARCHSGHAQGHRTGPASVTAEVRGGIYFNQLLPLFKREFHIQLVLLQWGLCSTWPEGSSSFSALTGLTSLLSPLPISCLNRRGSKLGSPSHASIQVSWIIP